MAIDERKNTLRQRIEEAFADIPSPGTTPEDIVEDYNNFEGEKMWTAKAFAGRHWKDMPLDAMSNNSAVACGSILMTVRAYHFFLPGFMIVTLDRSACHWEGVGTLVFTLTPPLPTEQEPDMTPEEIQNIKSNDRVIQKRHEERIRLLSPAQKEVVIDFLKHLRDVEEFDAPDSTDINRAISYLSKLNHD